MAQVVDFSEFFPWWLRKVHGMEAQLPIESVEDDSDEPEPAPEPEPEPEGDALVIGGRRRRMAKTKSSTILAMMEAVEHSHHGDNGDLPDVLPTPGTIRQNVRRQLARK